MNNELVELVVQLYEKNWGVKDYGLARAVVAMVLEEAAKKCDAIENKLTEQWKAGYKVCDYTQGASGGANDCAAAIRALKEK
jgi:predicted GNAT superfamily acetyltransferase